MAKSKSGMSQKQLDHHANQLNPNNPAFAARMDNHANQLNPNNPAFGDGKVAALGAEGASLQGGLDKDVKVGTGK